MAVGALPIFKLAILAVKQLSKPIANIIKERAKQSPFFRQYICMPPAQCKSSVRRVMQNQQTKYNFFPLGFYSYPSNGG